MSIYSENSIFQQINSIETQNLIERSQFNKRRIKFFFFSEEVRTKLASHFLGFEDYFMADLYFKTGIKSKVFNTLTLE